MELHRCYRQSLVHHRHHSTIAGASGDLQTIRRCISRPGPVRNGSLHAKICHMSDAPNVYIVDDEPASLFLVSTYLEGMGCEIRTYESGVEFLEASHLQAPGCILLDFQMPGLTGIEVQSRVIALDSRLPVIFMSGASTYEDVFEATKNGALAYLEKPLTRAKTRAAVDQALALSRELTNQFSSIARSRTAFANLTDREKQVFQLLVDGKPNKLIARKLAVSLRTVEFHRANIQKKLQANTLADLISIAKWLDL
jgi:two-component system response regulator FixJ